jgi:hypothetical protein
MRAVWGGLCALILFSGVQAAGLWSDQGPSGSLSSSPNPDNATVEHTDQTSRNTSSEVAVPSASAIAGLIIQQSRGAYYATGHPCACPDDLMRNGRRCGASSAYSKPGGAAPKCYVADVSVAEIERFRANTTLQNGAGR